MKPELFAALCTALTSEHQHGFGDKESVGMKPELFTASCTALGSEHQHDFGDKRKCRYETRVICSIVYGIKLRTPAWFWR